MSTEHSLPQSLDDWLEYISHQHSAEIVMGLERVRAVWEGLGRPQAPINIIVGGTNGKGSTCAMLESILGAAGFKTGFYSTSAYGSARNPPMTRNLLPPLLPSRPRGEN
jgi:folylpolyglutamate synthase/dihydropteroate synthase